jgi:hypothetical protein
MGEVEWTKILLRVSEIPVQILIWVPDVLNVLPRGFLSPSRYLPIYVCMYLSSYLSIYGSTVFRWTLAAFSVS